MFTSGCEVIENASQLQQSALLVSPFLQNVPAWHLPSQQLRLCGDFKPNTPLSLRDDSAALRAAGESERRVTNPSVRLL